ncbi:MAG: Flagellar hook-associated protein 2 [Pseudomonadota bacterium]
MATSSVSSSTSTAVTAAEIQAANKSAAQKLLTSLNAGSGVDTASLAQNLVDAERIPKENAINAKITKNENKISGLSSVMFMMNEFKTRLADLKDKTSYNSLTASNSNSTALNVTATNSAVAGTYNVNVSSLAKPQRSVSSGYAASSSVVNGGQPFNLTLSSSKAGVATGTTANPLTSVAKLVAPSFGASAPQTTDFSNFSITINGSPISLTPAPATADLSALAADLQSQIRATDSTISVSVDSGNLVFSSTDLSKRISAVSLTADAAVTDAATGTQQVPPAATFMASLSDISFGSSPSVTDFKSFSIVVGGKQFNITPNPATADLSALAEDLQKQLRAQDGTDELSVTVSGMSGLQFQSSNYNRKITAPTLSQSAVIRLDTGADVGSPTATGSGITGIKFGTTPQVTDFKSFTVKIGDSVRTIIPAPDAPTVSALAADIQKRLRILDGNDDVTVTANGSDIAITSKSNKVIANAGLSRTTYTDSPDGIIAAINDANRGVKAELVNDGSAGSPYKIMVTGQSGASEAFTLTSSAAGGLSFGTSAENQASDAVLSVNGVQYTRKSNSLSDVISGVTLELRSTTSTAATVALTQDTSAIKEKITALVTAYNDFDNIVKETTDPKSTLDTYGKTLVGDPTVKMIRLQIRSMFLGQSSTSTTALTSLGDLGFKTDQKGVLSLDETKLDGMLKNNYSDVVKLMTGNQSNISSVSTQPAGIAGDTFRRLNKLLANDGPLQSKSDNATTENTKYNTQLDKLKSRMESLLYRYTRQFSQMESLVGSVNSQKTSLKSTFDGMMSMYSSK